MIVAGEAFEAVYNNGLCALERLTRNGETVIADPVVWNLFRAATDNDGVRQWTGQHEKALGVWLACGLDRLTVTPRRTAVRTVKAGVEIVSAFDLVPHSGTEYRNIPISRDFPKEAKKPIRIKQTLRISPCGEISIDAELSIPKSIPDLPRIGLTVPLAPAFDTLTWFGLGPHETYCDKTEGGRVGLHREIVSEEHCPYTVPQEYGNHTETRSMAIASGTTTLTVAADGHFDASAHRCDVLDLFTAFHLNEVPVRDRTYLHLDHRMAGIGNASCGADNTPLPQYRIGPGTYRVSFTLGW